MAKIKKVSREEGKEMIVDYPAATSRGESCWDDSGDGPHCTRPAGHYGIHVSHYNWQGADDANNYVMSYRVRDL